MRKAILFLILSVLMLVPNMAVDASNCVAITSLPYTVLSAGNYCLTGNLTASGGGINIAASNVTIDFQGHTIYGSQASNNTFFGIYSNDRNNITIRNGEIVGFFYAVRIDDASYGRPEPYDTGGHLIEDMEISRSTFRGIVIRGQGNTIRNNIIRFIRGNTLYTNSFAIGIESTGQGLVVEDNMIYEVRGRGISDIGEGVGIAVSGAGSGSVIRDNVIVNSSIEENDNTDWAGLSRSTYAVWVGGDSNVVIHGNIIQNFMYGIGFPSTVEPSLIFNNTITNSYAPITASAVIHMIVGNVCDWDCLTPIDPIPSR